jgi:hypothetical protein
VYQKNHAMTYAFSALAECLVARISGRYALGTLIGGGA